MCLVGGAKASPDVSGTGHPRNKNWYDQHSAYACGAQRNEQSTHMYALKLQFWMQAKGGEAVWTHTTCL